MTHGADDVLTTVLDFAAALDSDDFERVAEHLDNDVTYSIDGVTHRGRGDVVDSYRQGSATARRIFDEVEFSHSIVTHDGETVRVDFSDRLTADGDVFEHHSVQDVTVGADGHVVRIVDRPVDGQRALLDDFMSRHDLTR